jgi:hypothetical protein
VSQDERKAAKLALLEATRAYLYSGSDEEPAVRQRWLEARERWRSAMGGAAE